MRIEDVAVLAGVAPITVSRAFRMPEKVSATTRARIERVVHETGYIPDLIAGSLASQKSRMVALLVPTIANPVHSDIVQGVSDVLRPAGYEVLLGNTGYSMEVEHHLVMTFIGRRADGLVLTGAAHQPETVRHLRAAKVPVVETWELPDDPIDMAVGFSNRMAAAEMTRHLIDRGYRNLAIIGHDAAADTRAAARVEGFRSTVRGYGMADPVVWLVPGPTTAEKGAQAVCVVVEANPKTDAVFFVSDMMAIGALLECQRRGWNVPGRVAIAGFGGSEIGALTNPPLTTVHVARRTIGEQAAQLLLRCLKGEPIETKQINVGFEIKIRQST